MASRLSFYKKLAALWKKQKTFLCLGLDSDRGFDFNKKIIDETNDVVCAYKPNSAFYEASGAKGIALLKKTCDYLRKTYPDIPIILDAKRADIGSTNAGYVSFAYEYLGADAITLHPYLGREALQPFLDRKEKGSIILCRTSNPGAGEFQDDLYQTVARHVAQDWNKNNNCALVVGATYPQQIAIVRRIVKDLLLLIPGIGVQGGDIEKAVTAGKDRNGENFIISTSRVVIFNPNPRKVAIQLRDEINKYR